MGRMGEGQVVEEAGIPRHVCDKGHVREGGWRTDGLSIPWHLLLREIGGIKSLRRARSWEVDFKMRAIRRSASRGRGPARQTETTPVAAVMTWDCADGLLPQSIIGAGYLVVVAMCGSLRQACQRCHGIEVRVQQTDAVGVGLVIFIQ